MTEFKAGDVVRLVRDGRNWDGFSGYGYEKGDEVTINGVNKFLIDHFGMPDGWTPYEVNDGGWVRSDDIELVSRKKEYRIGDTIRVNAHRNAFGDPLNYQEVVGKEFVIDDIGMEGVNKNGEHGDFVGLGLADCSYYVRSDDDLTLIARATTEQIEIADLKASNARLADANEAKRDRLNAIKEIVNADDVDSKDSWMITNEDGSFVVGSFGQMLFNANKSDYDKLLGKFTTEDGATFSIERFEDYGSGFGVSINLDPENQFFEASDLRNLAKHFKKLAKEMEKLEGLDF